MYKPRKENQDKATGRRMSDISPEEPNMMWLVTFTDVMGLMLTFFVLMFAMSTPEQKPFAEITSALQNEFNKFYGKVQNAGPEASVDIRRIDFDRALDLHYLEALMESLVAGNERLEPVVISSRGDRLVLSLPEEMLFESGSAMKAESNAPLFALGGAFSRMKNRVALSGYAPPLESGETSDWGVALSRAVVVAAALDKVGYNDPVVVRGASSMTPQNLEGIDEKAPRDLSIWVDIDIMNHDGRRRGAIGPLIVP